MKIGYIYYTFYPVTGGASVHGYNLAKELTRLGYKLYKLNGAPDPYTLKIKNPVRGLLWILAYCDLIYVRMDYFFNLRNFISLLALLARKKIIVELNCPSDELHLFGRSGKAIRRADRIMALILKRADAVVVVSDSIKEYCEKTLNLTNVHLIENGGEIFEDARNNASLETVEQIQAIKKVYKKVIVWAGSANKMQDLEMLKKIAISQKNSVALVMIVKEEQTREFFSFDADNLFIFKSLSREDVIYIISEADIGLAFYNEYPWSRWGFYNSSLKIFEYLNNGLLTLTNIAGTECQKEYPNFRQVKTEAEIIECIRSAYNVNVDLSNHPIRTWDDVAQETSRLIQKITRQ